MRPVARAVAAGTLVLCGALAASSACVPVMWSTYRNDVSRTGLQPNSSALSDPSFVSGTWQVRWEYPSAGTTGVAGGFSASPIVAGGTVYVGSQGGFLYALDEATGALKWQYPSGPTSTLSGGNDAYGVHASASYWPGGGSNGAIVFGAQDMTVGLDGGACNGSNACGGSARLYALDATTGALIWKSDVVATVNGNSTSCAPSELHEKIRFSSPLIFNGLAYVGVSRGGDDPVSRGKVVAVQLSNGHVASGFNFAAVPVGQFGGGVWNSPATDSLGVFFTTGNSNGWTGCPYSSGPPAYNGFPPNEPSPDKGLSLLRVDKDTGNAVWSFQPVPFALDCDDDWAAGATVMSTSCGTLITSVQKDGFVYAAQATAGSAGSPNVAWQFPSMGFPFRAPDGGTPAGNVSACGAVLLGDHDYKRPGAAWNDVLVINAGGESLRGDDSCLGYTEMHALNACATSDSDRVRWIYDAPAADVGSCGGYSLGAPTVTGGIVYFGTSNGHLLVVADPTVAPAAGYRCRDARFTDAAACCDALCPPGLFGLNFCWLGSAPLPAPYCNPFVPAPQQLKDVPVTEDGSGLAGMRKEPVLIDGRVFVASDSGHVYMLSPDAPQPPKNACGGTFKLAGVPGTACVSSTSSCPGSWQCEGTNEVICVARAPNVCGGCNPLPPPGIGRNTPGASCPCAADQGPGVLRCNGFGNYQGLTCCCSRDQPGCAQKGGL